MCWFFKETLLYIETENIRLCFNTSGIDFLVKDKARYVYIRYIYVQLIMFAEEFVYHFCKNLEL
jgi:hypothetical protein